MAFLLAFLVAFLQVSCGLSLCPGQLAGSNPLDFAVADLAPVDSRRVAWLLSSSALAGTTSGADAAAAVVEF